MVPLQHKVGVLVCCKDFTVGCRTAVELWTPQMYPTCVLPAELYRMTVQHTVDLLTFYAP